jgi:hypothetical protein
VPEVTELTLRQWIDSVWFRGLSRVSMIVTSLLLTGFVVVWGFVAGDTTAKVVKLDAQVQAVAGSQTARAIDSEAFQVEVRGKVSAVQADLFAMKVDIGVIKGILTDMRRENVATRFSSPGSSVPAAGR